MKYLSKAVTLFRYSSVGGLCGDSSRGVVFKPLLADTISARARRLHLFCVN